jgi:hypothetical protein
MPKCSKIFKDRQALGNHIKTHLDDSDDDVPNQSNPTDTTTRDLPNKKIKLDHCIDLTNDPEVQHLDIHMTGISNFSPSNEKSAASNMEESKEVFDKEVDDEEVDDDESDEEEFDEEEFDDDEFDDDEFDDEFLASDAESVVAPDEASESPESDEESVTSNLSYTTNVDANECIEYDALHNQIPRDAENIHQEFPSEEYAEFMYMITQFHIEMDKSEQDDYLTDNGLCYAKVYINIKF